MKNAAALLYLTTTICCAGAAPAPGTPADPTSPSGPAGAPAESKTQSVPDFTLETIDGKTVSLSEYVGKKVVLIDFWATWCEPCLAAMPHLRDMHGKYKDQGFEILSISMDGPDTVAEVRAYTLRNKLPFPVLLDEESRAVSLYNPSRAAPFSILMAKDGTILHKRDGYQAGDEVAIEKEIADALQKK